MIRVASPHLSSLSSNHSDLLVTSPKELRTQWAWKHADAVCFDVDSTVCPTEAIDELADYLGVGEAVVKATQKAMNGNTGFREALANRLSIMQPTLETVIAFAAIPPKLTNGIAELVEALHERGTDVYLVSGGFRRLISPVAEMLNIPQSRIFANEILFDDEGNYAGFDKNELTSDSGSIKVGKAGVCGLLKSKHGYRNLVMVGDGATDMEAVPPADAFIGFGGNAVREAVKKGAGWFVTSFDEMREALK